ncbi:hypothetical protein SAMN05444280_10795 [Tangfeifania diversioriginum]|uniref:Uncharacterized protein n=1 Tax=Tangfeifania diversioriginum TaxID=1168035 RepID=A0A1M6ERK3_9BACT|nr:hypothetical protein SAMN05444280_10795 [Tangfeifania diversioriginum]
MVLITYTQPKQILTRMAYLANFALKPEPPDLGMLQFSNSTMSFLLIKPD